ncbi:MAG: hypothetical protein FD180_2732 [Planctomycetota bacterium]|nr:MAG: hypothetical protein FD180_2732 [Planctomycetota bacterium]
MKTGAMARTKPCTVISGLFETREAAERAYESLVSRGYARSEISVLLSKETRRRLFGIVKEPLDNKLLEGAAVGGTIGGAAGALSAAMLAVGTALVIPGAAFTLIGPITAALAGAGAGGAVGTLVGALVGADIPEKHIKIVSTRVHAGDILVSVKPKSEADGEAILKDWRRYAHKIL